MKEKEQAGLLASIALLVTPTSSQEWSPLQVGHFLHAFFYDTVTLSDPTLADRLHHSNGLQPFTVSLPLQWKYPTARSGPALSVPTFRIRFTALTKEVYQALVEGLMRRFYTSPQLFLGPHSLEIQQILFTHNDSPFAWITSYEELYSSSPAHVVRMRFVTPTSFRAGRGNLPFPLPTSVYRGLWQKWRYFAPPALQLNERVLTAVEQYLFPARYALHTETVSLKGVPQVGCVGMCQFELLEAVPAEDQRAITALSRFAAYAGVGMKTTMGMGQTMVEVEEAPTQGHKPVGEENGEGT